MINERDDIASPVDINQIPLDDGAVYSLLQSAETTAVFQLESRGMKELIKSLRPDCFEDIIALGGPCSGRGHSSRVWSKTSSIESTVESKFPTRMRSISTSGYSQY
jgi:hypothetical protein